MFMASWTKTILLKALSDSYIISYRLGGTINCFSSYLRKKQISNFFSNVYKKIGKIAHYLGQKFS